MNWQDTVKSKEELLGSPCPEPQNVCQHNWDCSICTQAFISYKAGEQAEKVRMAKYLVEKRITPELAAIPAADWAEIKRLAEEQ